MSGIARKAAPVAADARTFSARVYRVGGPPDGDGDIIERGAVTDGHRVKVSRGEHEVVTNPAAVPVGTARLFHVADAVIAHGQLDESPGGQWLRSKLLESGAAVEWSVAWPTASVVARAPTAKELERWPDAKRIIQRWAPIEISPVARGSCGPSCRTLGAKSCGCGCRTSKAPDPAEVAAVVAESKRVLRRAARLHAAEAALREPQGPLALDIADRATRWLSNGSEHEPPGVVFYDYDGKAAGRYDPASPDVVFVSRGLSDDELIRAVAHQVSHWRRPWDPSEAVAQADAEFVVRRYRATFQPETD